MLLGSRQNALQADHEEVAEQVGANVLGPPAHVVLLETRDPRTDGGFDLSDGFHSRFLRAEPYDCRPNGGIIKSGLSAPHIYCSKSANAKGPLHLHPKRPRIQMLNPLGCDALGREVVTNWSDDET